MEEEKMINLTIDGVNVQAKEGMTILEAARSANIDIPTLCFLKGVNEIGACRMCVVEVEGIVERRLDKYQININRIEKM